MAPSCGQLKMLSRWNSCIALYVKLINGNKYEQIKVKKTTADLFWHSYFHFYKCLNRIYCQYSDVDLWPPVAQEGFLTEIPFLISLLTEGSGPESFQPVIFCDGMKNILKQHLLLEEGQTDRSVAKQPLWLLFCHAGPLTRFSVKVASVWFDSCAKLKTRRNQRWACLLLMWRR